MTFDKVKDKYSKITKEIEDRKCSVLYRICYTSSITDSVLYRICYTGCMRCQKAIFMLEVK